MKLIIVDDHAIVRDGLRLMLDSEIDIDVVGEAAGGEELLELVERLETDIVLLDMRMEGMHGLDALEILSERHPGIQVVVLTMHGDASLLGRAVELGARGYVLKGSGREVVLEALRTVASGKAFVDPQLTEDLISLTSPTQPAPLAEKDLEILRLLASGHPNREIAARAGMTSSQLRARLREVYAVLEVSSRAEAIAAALRRGLID
jgi:DNA-binding NarL/FixJ family response regulator